MRGAHIVLAALTAACSGAPDAQLDSRVGAGERNEGVILADAGSPVVAPLNFCSVGTEASPYANFDAALETALNRWGARLVDGDCDRQRTLTVLFEPLRPSERDGATLGKGHRESLTLRVQSDPEVGPVANISPDDCLTLGINAGEQRPFLLTAVLTHEVGHLLGLGHSDNEGDAMFWRGERCRDSFPSEAELDAAVGP